MRHVTIINWAMVVLIGMGAGLPGCALVPVSMLPPPAHQNQGLEQMEPEPLGQQVQAYTDHISRAAVRDEPPAGGYPTVHWLEAGRVRWPSAAQTQANPAKRQATAQQKVAQAPAENWQIQTADVTDPAPRPERRALDRGELIDLLLADVQTSEAQDMRKALTAATLCLADPKRELDPEFLKPLDKKEQEQVRRYHELMEALGKKLADGKTVLDADALEHELESVFGKDPIRIQDIKLCKRVRSYGVYDEIEDHSFLAGRENKMIVYVELDDFQTKRGADDMYEVHLTQQVSLFNESGSLVVWQHPKVQIVDSSRNRRRDFFEVQLIALPAQLNVGKYWLKVNVTDKHGDCRDERSMPINIVVDQSLVGK